MLKSSYRIRNARLGDRDPVHANLTLAAHLISTASDLLWFSTSGSESELILSSAVLSACSAHARPLICAPFACASVIAQLKSQDTKGCLRALLADYYRPHEFKIMIVSVHAANSRAVPRFQGDKDMPALLKRTSEDHRSARKLSRR